MWKDLKHVLRWDLNHQISVKNTLIDLSINYLVINSGLLKTLYFSGNIDIGFTEKKARGMWRILN